MRRAHDLTPVASRQPATFAAIAVAILTTSAAAVVLFGLFPGVCWDPRHDTGCVLDFATMGDLLGTAVSTASPSQLHFFGDEDMIFRIARIFSQICAWISFLWKCPLEFCRLIVESDAGIQLSIRMLGVGCAAASTAVPVYRHVLFRTPLIRRARYIDGPQIFWFRAATAKAVSFLSPMSREFPNGVELAPSLPLPRKAEHESFFALGLPGSGKSVVIGGAAFQAIARGDRIVCIDIKGIARKRISKFFGRGASVALGLGRECCVWAIAADAGASTALGRIVTTLIPESREPVWSSASRLVLKALLNRLNVEHGSSWGWIELKAEISYPVEEIAARVRTVMPQVAEMLRGKGDDPTTMSLSVIFNLVAQVSEIVDTCARFEAEGRPRFSLIKWAGGRSAARAIVLEHDMSNPEDSALLLSVELRIIIGELLGSSLPDGKDHRIWMFADELPRFKAAAPDVSELAAVGRSRGIRVVASAQSLAQLERAMSRAEAEALIENFGTIVICRGRPGRNTEDIATHFVGKTTYETVSTADKHGLALHERPGLSPLQMTTCLGLTVDWRGQKYIRAAIVGWGDVYVTEWPLDRWKTI